MGCWDTLCFLCGVAPNGGPQYLAMDWDLDNLLKPVIAEIRQLGAAKDLDDEQLLQVLEDGFIAGCANDRVLPRGYGYRDYSSTCIGVGYWDSEGNFNSWSYCCGGKHESVPDGFDVEILRLRDADGYGGIFNTVVVEGRDGKEEEVRRHIDCHPGYWPCFFLCEHCYHYLKEWTDFHALPKRSHAFPDDPENISFAG